jgi:copper transport protein
MTWRRRIWASLGAVVVLVLAMPRPAAAHALLVSSDPADGSRLSEAPAEMLLRFTEPPELALSSVALLDRTGADLGAGDAQEVAAEPTALRVPVPDLEQGVYTVTWRVVSRVDGHPTEGAFVFGIGLSPLEVQPHAAMEEHEDPSVLEVTGRLVLFVGLGLLVGGAWVGALAFANLPRAVRHVAGWAWLIGVVGLLVLAVAQQQAAEVGFGAFLPTTVGRALLYRGAAIVVAGAGLLAASLRPAWRRPALLVAGAAAVVAILIHVAAGHAAARGELAWAKVIAQWVHFTAVGVWLGGLAALLVGVRGKEEEAKAAAVRRFSAVAAYALAAVAITGLVRAVNEVGSWGDLFTTGYGQFVLVKVGLLLLLAGLGAINRWRNVPRADTSLRPLRRVSRGELALAVGALATAALLATLVPPAQVPAEAGAPGALTATGSDFATSVRARLELTPALPGSNHFDLRVIDYDSGEPVTAQRVSLTFSHLIGEHATESQLDLHAAGDGRYEATGSVLSIGGPWEITVLVQRGADAVEVPLQLATLCEAQVSPGTGDRPTIHTVEVPRAGSVEGYLVPLGGGRAEVHFTFLDAHGKPLRVEEDPTISAWQRGQDTHMLHPELVSRGHYFGVAELGPGPWRFDGSASGHEAALAGCFEQTLQG